WAIPSSASSIRRRFTTFWRSVRRLFSLGRKRVRWAVSFPKLPTRALPDDLPIERQQNSHTQSRRRRDIRAREFRRSESPRMTRRLVCLKSSKQLPLSFRIIQQKKLKLPVRLGPTLL